MREEFLELLRTNQAFREDVRRQILTEDLLALPARLDHLTELVGQSVSLLRETVGVVRRLAEVQLRTEEGIGQLEGRMDGVESALQRLTEAQLRTEEELRSLASWQRGESGRRDGERYEQETIRRALALFNGGQGGGPDQPWVQQRLMEQLGSHMAWGLLEPEEDPLLADVLWWKGEQLAVVEISLQVNGQDVARAARRATTLRQAGPQTLAVVIGEDWATPDSRDRALTQQVEWKVGSDLSEGLLAFRRATSR